MGRRARPRLLLPRSPSPRLPPRRSSRRRRRPPRSLLPRSLPALLASALRLASATTLMTPLAHTCVLTLSPAARLPLPSLLSAACPGLTSLLLLLQWSHPLPALPTARSARPTRLALL